MLVGLCSDTHDNLELAERAVETFEREGVETVIHCGDVVAPFTAAVFDAGFDFHAVRGNNDGEWALADAIDGFGTYHGESAHLTFEGSDSAGDSDESEGAVDVAVYHGTSERLVDALVDCGGYDYVVRGHTHEHGAETRGGTVHVNPGGLPFDGADDAYHVAVLDTATGDVAFHEIDA
ncbi:metallophosphoesterase family protein [Halobellus rufus]|uniref:metallophosphoesterase family protein n=1 Tax=Halobellus rufus TaxID=1448860 RepID=UPI0006787976|nr:metallophosphoesterase family protein [Halobellus rufus]